jgi:hypothetical protein
MQPVSPIKHVYPSRIDAWLAAALVAAPVLCVGMGVWLVGQSPGAGICAMFTGMFIAAIIGTLSWPCHYTLEGDYLEIRTGMHEQRVAIGEIRSLEATTSLVSAPAFSVHRVRIVTDRETFHLSPRDREGFMAELSARIAERRGA